MDTVLIVIDALRRSDVGCYGREDNITPAIDRIAAEGTVYENAISQSNFTDVCMSSIMSGQAPEGHGVKNHGASYTEQSLKGIQEANTEFLPQALSKEGIRTIGLDWLGRWHRWGYDEYGVGEDVRNEKGLMGLLRAAIKTLPAPVVHEIRKLLWRVNEPTNPGANCEELTDMAIDSLEENTEDSFTLVHYWDVHPPFRPPEGYDDDYKFDGEDKPLSYYFQAERKGKVGAEYAMHINGLRETLAESKRAYDGTISWVDEQVGRLYDYLEQSDRLEETLFIVTADHGHHFGEQDIFSDNCTLYDTSVRIPLVIHHPGKASGRVEKTVQHTDLRPTIHDFHDIAQPMDTRGNVLPEESHEYGFAEAEGERMRAIRTLDWKLIKPLDTEYLTSQYWYNHEGEPELYDLKQDPEETENVADEHPDRTAQMMSLLESEMQEQREIERTGGSAQREEVSEDEIDQIQANLEALGYVEDG